MTFVSDLEIIVAKIQVINTANNLAQMEVESFAAGVPVFPDRKERPKEAPFMALKKRNSSKNL
nr:hypothetical protein [uncultured Flavobacterium sp.]